MQYPLGLYRPIIFHSLEEYAVNGAILALLSYGWFCLFQAWRGIMLTARRKGIKAWRLHYVASLLLTTVFPVVTITFFAWADKTMAMFSPLICAIVLLKAYRHYDLLNEEKTPAVADWSYQLGKEYAEARWAAISRPELIAPLNHHQCLLRFLMVWGAVAYCCSYALFLVLVVLVHSVTIGMLVGFVGGGVGALLFVTHFSKTIYEYEITQSLSSKSIWQVLCCIFLPLVVCSLLLPNHSYPLTWAEEPLDCLALALALPLTFGWGIYTALRRLAQYQPLDSVASH
ncbi:MAG: hypothetical protein EOO61_22450 [Hymenobacter sp.]|nr:MAG: hypothetical protein EOO61_22450 [Hymenobacter sp.]